ncbi:transposase [Bdellovibrio svalbardensis]|uniref:Transposase n=1 Tax=Bdellovibrio svalbardensis TaxID=2972972 RepID=A0ABT6DJI3_9BACT|nr:transposase [Bdellovibrio svalbardensis]MDG0816958.1 transposase [Bdellovibrio svalbardensis]
MPRTKFVRQSELPYHVTARCINKEWFAIEMPVIWEIMTRNLYFLSHAFNLRIHAFILMSNHFHMIVRTPNENLSEAMGFFMTQTSKEIAKVSKRINHAYGGRYHRTMISSPLYYLHAYKYLYRNPVTAGICEKVEDYPYSSLKGLIGETWLEVPVTEDEHWGNLADREETLAWLNSAPPPEHWELVRLALRKKEFILAKVNKKPSTLETNAL